MSPLLQKLKTAPVLAMVVLIAGLYISHSTSTRFLTDMRKDRDAMVASLHKAQTPEPQIVAISAGFDRITSNVDSMTTAFFAFTLFVIIVVILGGRVRRGMTQGELRHDHGA